jgi:hypothetical protein
MRYRRRCASADVDQAGLTQDSQVFGDPGLAELEPLHEVANGAFALAHEVEDPSPARFRKNVERGRHQLFPAGTAVGDPLLV